eukprot:2609502-Rhodomonas_salina.1
MEVSHAKLEALHAKNGGGVRQQWRGVEARMAGGNNGGDLQAQQWREVADIMARVADKMAAVAGIMAAVAGIMAGETWGAKTSSSACRNSSRQRVRAPETARNQRDCR